MKLVLRGAGGTLAFLVSVVLFGSSGSAQAQLLIEKNFMRDLLVGPTTMMQTPGQAMTTVIVSSPEVNDDLLRCLIPDFGCEPAGVASLDLDVSALGVSAQAAGQAGGDMASSSLALSSLDGENPFDFATFDVLSGDFQRIRFEVTGGDLPEFIDVDVTFSVAVSVDDRSTVSSGAVYFPFAQAGIEVLEADTATFDPMPQVFAPFSALGIVDPSITNGPDSVDVVDTTETMSVRPNTDYWVRQITQSTVLLLEGDFSGLDVSVSTFVDPTFALNPEFAASNPDIAAAFTIDRVLTVPEPKAEVLAAAALAALVLLRPGLRRFSAGSA